MDEGGAAGVVPYIPRPLVRIRAQLYTREEASASACCRRVHLIWNGAADERADRAGHRLRCRGGDRLCSRSVRRDAQLLPDFMRSHQSDSHSHFHTFSPPSLTFLFEYIFSSFLLGSTRGHNRMLHVVAVCTARPGHSPRVKPLARCILQTTGQGLQDSSHHIDDGPYRGAPTGADCVP